MHIHTPLCLSDSLSCRPFHLLFLLQMWEMKRIGSVIFKCRNTLAKSATSTNTSTCIQYTCTHPHEINIMLYCCWNSGWSQTRLYRPVVLALSSASVYSVSLASGNKSPERQVTNHTQILYQNKDRQLRRTGNKISGNAVKLN